jgi:hypothetical protein
LPSQEHPPTRSGCPPAWLGTHGTDEERAALDPDELADARRYYAYFKSSHPPLIVSRTEEELDAVHRANPKHRFTRNDVVSTPVVLRADEQSLITWAGKRISVPEWIRGTARSLAGMR